MIDRLPNWYLHNNAPSFYDEDAVTLLELAARLHGSMNELIEDYNTRSAAFEKRISEFETGVSGDFMVHETALRQEFQDFIDVVDLKVLALTKEFEDFQKVIENALGNLPSGGGEGGSAAPADWSINDPDAPGYVKNRTHYYNQKGFLIEWDGNTEGKTTVHIGGNINMSYAKVSDFVPSFDVVRDCEFTGVVGGQVTPMPKENIQEMWDQAVSSGGITDDYAILPLFIITTKDNVTLPDNSYDVTFPTKGVYFVYQEGALYVSKMEQPSSVEKLPKEFLPNNIVLSNKENVNVLITKVEIDKSNNTGVSEIGAVNIFNTVLAGGMVYAFEEIDGVFYNYSRFFSNYAQFSNVQYVGNTTCTRFINIYMDGTVEYIEDTL